MAKCNIELTPAEQSRRGKLSGEARRRKATMQKTAKLVLEMGIGLLDDQILEAIKYLKPEMSVQDAIIYTQAIKAIQFADTKAAEFVRDTSGQKPTEKQKIEGHISYEAALKKYAGNDDTD